MAGKTHQNPSSVQFPQPTRPINSYDTDMNCSSSLEPRSWPDHATYDVVYPIANDDNNINICCDASPALETVLEEEDEEDREVLEKKLVKSILENIYEKLPEKIRQKLNFDKKMGQIISQKGLQDINLVYSTRGLEGSDDQMEEFAQRLERFKIRTLDPNGGVDVKEETKK